MIPITAPVRYFSIIQSLMAFVNTSENVDNDFSPMLFAFVVMAGVIVLALIGVGVVLGACVVALSAVSLAFGILSASVLIGYLSKSVKAGVKTGILLLSGVLGIPMGVMLLFAIRFIRDGQYPDLFEVLIPGGLAGVIGGVMMGFVFLRALTYLKGTLEARYKLSN